MGKAVRITPPSRGGDGAAEARRWQPTPVIQASLLLHAAAVIALIVHPVWWPWLLAALLANHVALGLIGMWPRSRLLGPNMLRLPEAAAARGEIALTFDDGPDPAVTPEVLDILDRYHAKASFFCIGDKAAAHPDIVREIARRGHSVENHSLRHSHFFGFYGLSALRRDLAGAQNIVGAITGRPPAFFRSPMGIRNPFLDPVVARLGLRYVAWTRRGFDAVKRDPEAVLTRLVRGLAAGDILLLHDRIVAGAQPVIFEVLPALLEKISAAGLKPVSLPMAMQ
jgi:peptidoglycan/xylan/chitin deacetylase (PgdA/CDA1 family)